MTNFHILYYENKEDFFSKGRDVIADSPENAISEWRKLMQEEKITNAVFAACYVKIH